MIRAQSFLKGTTAVAFRYSKKERTTESLRQTVEARFFCERNRSRQRSASAGITSVGCFHYRKRSGRLLTKFFICVGVNSVCVILTCNDSEEMIPGIRRDVQMSVSSQMANTEWSNLFSRL